MIFLQFHENKYQMFVGITDLVGFGHKMNSIKEFTQANIAGINHKKRKIE